MSHLRALIVRKQEPSGAVTTYSYYPQEAGFAKDLLRDETYSLDGSTFYVNRHFYDDKGRLTETEYAIPASSYEPGSYSREANLGLKEVHYDNYNALGQPGLITEYVKDGDVYRLTKKTERGYTPQGDLESETVKDVNGCTVSRVTYEYDSHGRLTRECRWQDEQKAQERRLAYEDVGLSRFRPTEEYLSHHQENGITYYERRTTSFFGDGQPEEETSAVLGHFSGNGEFVVDDASHQLTVS